MRPDHENSGEELSDWFGVIWFQHINKRFSVSFSNIFFMLAR